MQKSGLVKLEVTQAKIKNKSELPGFLARKRMATRVLWNILEVQRRQIRKIRNLFTSSIEREIRHFHVVVVQWRQRNVQKTVMDVQNCCFS